MPNSDDDGSFLKTVLAAGYQQPGMIRHDNKPNLFIPKL